MCSRCVLAYVEEVRKCFKEAYAEVHLQTNNEVDREKQYYDRATSTVQLMPGDVVIMKLDAFQGKRKVKDQWRLSMWLYVRSQMMCPHMRYEMMAGMLRLSTVIGFS